ncbi:MAG: hypothetical protein F6K42_16760 [Leptolyngbya sp. SIO1D8]|nr:hypothetical protein [Leptolyngbya sp. SIO1D8]
MFQLFKPNDSLTMVWRNQRLVIDLKQLKQEECLIIKYDQAGNPIALQKFGTDSLRGGSVFGRAESDILPGQKGRVVYDGCSWQAYCQGDRAIYKDQRVLITARISLHLFVMPVEAPFEDLL